MKALHFRRLKGHAQGGFSLVEVTLSLGLMTFGFLTLVPLLALGMKTARLARNDRATAEIAQTLIEQARQGTLAAGTEYLDTEGNVTSLAQAAYTVQASFLTVTDSASLTRLTLQIKPLGAPDRARTYAVMLSPSS